MDSNKMDLGKPDELRDRRREEALARRMGEALDRLSAPEASQCPDAEIIAAYQEQALVPEEIAAWEGHFAQCARCRKILAVLSASVDAPLAEAEVARLGELVAAALPGAAGSTASVRLQPAHPSEKITPIRRSGGDWRVRWLAPALGVAAVLAMWFAVRPPWRATETGPSGTLIAEAPKNELQPPAEPEEADRLSKVAPEQNQKETLRTPGSQPSRAPQPLNNPENAAAGRQADAGNTLATPTPSPEVATSTLQKREQLDRVSNAPVPQRSAPPPPAPPPAAKTESEAASANAVPQAPAAAGGLAAGTIRSESVMRDKQLAAPQAVAGPRATAQFSTRAALSAEADKDTVEGKAAPQTSALMKSPSGSTIWRAGSGGSIERSTDVGRTWTPQTSPSREEWLAVAAVSDTVGWLAGRNGAIARTINGERWEQVAPPTQAADSTSRSPDWTGITARDAQNATITARDGRRFGTQDGGKTWQRQ